MSAPGLSDKLHLPDLTIQGFCGISDLTINRLGRVTLIAGMNGVGKTTLLDAVRVFAGRGHPSDLLELLERRDELHTKTEEYGVVASDVRWNALFYGRQISEHVTVTIGPTESASQLRLYVRPPSPEELRSVDEFLIPPELLDHMWTLSASYGREERATVMSPAYLMGSRRLRLNRFSHIGPEIQSSAIGCESVGPNLTTMRETQARWESVALTDAENHTVDAINLITDQYSRIERVALIGDGRSIKPRAMVRIAGCEQPVALKTLGDGAVRIFDLTLALATSRDGFLLIDEVANGVHHSVQDALWKMILKFAQDNSVQVLATTHSWDAVASYARATSELDQVDGTLVRIERDGDGTYAVEYSEEDLEVAAEQGIEVR